jgi:hypothetical protein
LQYTGDKLIDMHENRQFERRIDNWSGPSNQVRFCFGAMSPSEESFFVRFHTHSSIVSGK